MKFKIAGVLLFVVAVALVISATSAPLWAMFTGEDEELDFNEVSAERGFEYDSSTYEQYGNTRGGVYVSDYDNNEYPDVLAIGGDGPALFKNTNGSFERTEALPEFPDELAVRSAVFFDHDNDGWEDLLLLPLGESPIFLENNEGTYSRRSVGFDTVELSNPSGASVADYDDDGCMDVFISQNGDWHFGAPKKEMQANDPGNPGAPERVHVREDNGNQNYFFEGDCESFTNSTDEVGITGNRWTTTQSFVDFTGDGYPDIHVANDFNYDYLFVNQNGSGFEPRRIPQTNRHGMASEVADFNHDGRMDIFVTNMYWENETWTDVEFESAVTNRGSNLLINVGGGNFETEEIKYGVYRAGWGWAASAVDLNNDGRRDLIHSNRMYRPSHDKSELIFPYPKLFLRENESTFEGHNASEFGFERMNGRGLANLDFNRDGFQDVVVADMRGKFKLYENQATDGNWLQIAVREESGRTALGARITVSTQERSYPLVVNPEAGLNSQDTKVKHVGLGDTTAVSLNVTWPDGTTEKYDDVKTNQRVVIHRGGYSNVSDGSLALVD